MQVRVLSAGADSGARRVGQPTGSQRCSPDQDNSQLRWGGSEVSLGEREESFYLTAHQPGRITGPSAGRRKRQDSTRGAADLKAISARRGAEQARWLRP